MLDGFPRTIPQAEVLDKAIKELGDKIDYAINVEVPDENIVRRMSGRRACLSCGATFHIEHIPPNPLLTFPDESPCPVLRARCQAVFPLLSSTLLFI